MAEASELTERAKWRYVCQDCDFVTMDMQYAAQHEDGPGQHTVMRNRAFKEDEHNN